jgi:hypothetical protein
VYPQFRTTVLDFVLKVVSESGTMCSVVNSLRPALIHLTSQIRSPSLLEDGDNISFCAFDI